MPSRLAFPFLIFLCLRTKKADFLVRNEKLKWNQGVTASTVGRISLSFHPDRQMVRETAGAYWILRDRWKKRPRLNTCINLHTNWMLHLVIYTRLCFRISIAHCPGLSLAIGCIIATLVTPKCAVCRGLLCWLHWWSLLILCSPNICHFVCSVLSIVMTKVNTYYSAYYMDFCLFLYDHSVFLSLCTQLL